MEYTAFDQLLMFDPNEEAARQAPNAHRVEQLKLSMTLAQEHEEKLRDELFLRDDTYHGMTYADAKRVFESEGFSLFLEQQLPEDDNMFALLWRKDGIMAVLDEQDTDNGSLLDAAYVIYNWSPDSVEAFRAFHDPEGFGVEDGGDKIVWCGCFDASEAFKHRLSKLKTYGKFITPWKGIPETFWVLDSRVESDLIDALPFDIQEVIGQ